VLDLLSIKKSYVKFSVSKQEISEAQYKSITTKVIIPLRNIINDAIAMLSPEELLSVYVDTGKIYKDSILCVLGEMGEIALFKNVFCKLKKLLSLADLHALYDFLQDDYEGISKIAEELGLCSSFLNRGNFCYIALAEWILTQINNPAQFLTGYLKYRNLNVINLSMINEPPQMSLEYFKEKVWVYGNHKKRMR